MCVRYNSDLLYDFSSARFRFDNGSSLFPGHFKKNIFKKIFLIVKKIYQYFKKNINTGTRRTESNILSKSLLFKEGEI